jgi:hydroxypyruvate reductase
MQAATRELLSCGASIQEINCIRKHISAIKGGRLAELISPAQSINLILSDVVGDDLQSIASGLTVPDRSTYSDAVHIIDKYAIRDKIPESVLTLLSAGAEGKAAETPKPGADCFSRSRNVLLGTNAVALHAAAVEAETRGYHSIVLSSKVTGEAREIAKFYAAIAREAAETAAGYRDSNGPTASDGSIGSFNRETDLYTKPLCILAGGETTVTIRGNGKGGRNQEMALAFLSEIASLPEAFQGVLFASIATDGNDGPTDAAGAFASVNLAERAEQNNLNIIDYLSENDAYNFFDKIKGLIKTGPTNTNVCDIQVLLVT